jgi:hypothetical protein
MRLKIVLEESDEGGYTAHVPSLPGCISEGETKEEALKNIAHRPVKRSTLSHILKQAKHVWMLIDSWN